MRYSTFEVVQMPVVYRYKGFRFFFWSDEHPPIHIHVEGYGGKAKFNSEDGVELVESRGFSKRDIKVLRKFCEDYR